MMDEQERPETNEAQIDEQEKQEVEEAERLYDGMDIEKPRPKSSTLRPKSAIARQKSSTPTPWTRPNSLGSSVAKKQSSGGQTKRPSS